MEELILKYLRDEVSEKERIRVEAWISSSEANMRKFNALKSIVDASSPAFDRKGIDVEKAYANVVRKSRRRTLTAAEMFRRVAAVLFIPLVCLSSGLAVYSFVSGMKTDETIQKVSIPYGAVSEFVLSDGSRIWLGSGSSLEYPVAFEKGTRTVCLEGEAVFKVKADAKHPFVVNAGDVSVMALGTEFAVNSYDFDTLSTVALKKGSVKVSFQGRSTDEIVLVPDNLLTFDRKKSEYMVSVNDSDKWFSWASGLTIFSNDRLSAVLGRLRQLYNAEFVLKDKSLGDYCYRATFERESLDEILNVIQMSVPVKFIRIDADSEIHSGRKYDVVSSLN